MDLVTLANWLPFTGALALLGFLTVRLLDYRALSIGVQDTPVSPVGGVQVGLASVRGQADSDHRPYSPIACMPTAWWEVVVETGPKNDSSERTKVYSACSDQPLVVRDGTGSIRVDTKGAVFGTTEVDGPIEIDAVDFGTSLLIAERELAAGSSAHSLATILALSGYQRRNLEKHYVVTTRYLPVGAEVSVIGPAILDRTTPDATGVMFRAQNDSADSADATDAARFADEARHRQLFITMGTDRDARGQTFKLLAGAWALCLAAAAGTGFCLVMAMLRWREGAEADSLAAEGAVLVAGLWVFGWVAAGVVRLRNRLVAVSQRAERARGNLDVALKRRHDLVPQLVDVVRAHATYDREVQTLVAGLRSGEAGADTSAPVNEAASRSSGLSAVAAVAERLPTLRADEAFRLLVQQLIALEADAAMARSMHADAVQILDDRMGRLPGLLVAPFVPKVLGRASDVTVGSDESEANDRKMPARV